MKKKHYIIPQIFNYFFAAISVYFFACLYQAQVISTDMIIIGGTITDADGKVTRPMNSYENVKVSRGERVTLAFRIPARSVSGWNHIERHLIDATNAEHIVSTMNRRWTANSRSWSGVTSQSRSMWPLAVTRSSSPSLTTPSTGTS